MTKEFVYEPAEITSEHHSEATKRVVLILLNTQPSHHPKDWFFERVSHKEYKMDEL